MISPPELEQRFNDAVPDNWIPDEQLWFIVDSVFNPHTATLRAWAQKGRPSTRHVGANRETKLTVEVIGPDEIKFLEIRDGAFFSKAFLESMKALIRRFLELRRCEVTCDGQHPDPQGKACY